MKSILIFLSFLPVFSYAGDHHTRPSGYAVGIEIVDAWYGTRDRSCDASYALDYCRGRSQCSIEATNRLCGDPAKGVRKSLAVRYTCGAGVETVYVEEDRATTLSCSNRGRRNDRRFDGRVPRGSGIEILRADYGAGRRYCDAGYAFADQCTGKNLCRVYVNNDLCGDPFSGKKKSVEIEYRCGSRIYREQAREDSTAVLQCR